MQWLRDKLKGSQSLDEALDARLRRIAAIGQRGPGYVLRTSQERGYSQTELHPPAARKAPAAPGQMSDRLSKELLRSSLTP